MTLTMTDIPSEYLGEQVILTLFNRTNTGCDPACYGQANLDAISMVPEPAAFALLAAGGMVLIRRHRA